MSAEELVHEVHYLGGTLWLEIGREGHHSIHYRLPAKAASLLDELRRRKDEIVPILRRRSFAQHVPFLGKRVWTSEGSGTLVELQDYAVVQHEDMRKTRHYDSTAVVPYV